jgi:hypothetical protein
MGAAIQGSDCSCILCESLGGAAVEKEDKIVLANSEDW